MKARRLSDKNGGHTPMFDFMNGLMASGQGWRTLQDGRDVIEMHPGALGIVAGILGIILWALAATALVLAIMTMIRRLRGRGGVPVVEVAAVDPAVPDPADAAARASALQILNDLFARGEIGQEEYMDRRKALLGGM